MLQPPTIYNELHCSPRSQCIVLCSSYASTEFDHLWNCQSAQAESADLTRQLPNIIKSGISYTP